MVQWSIFSCDGKDDAKHPTSNSHTKTPTPHFKLHTNVAESGFGRTVNTQAGIRIWYFFTCNQHSNLL